MNFEIHNWQRHPQNPIFPPGDNDFDCTACMNPFVVQRGQEYFMFYAGGDKNAARRICLAVAPVGDITNWKRLGPLFETGQPNAFDEMWCVLPCVHFINGRWHLYYSGRDKSANGLQSFWGIGLATSDDLLHWEKYSDEPVLRGDGFSQWPDNKGIAGGGRILEVEENGETLYRMYYTLATGTSSPDLLTDQAKQAVIADSRDGINWFDKRVVLQPRRDAEYENAATIALNVWQEKKQSNDQSQFQNINPGNGKSYSYEDAASGALNVWKEDGNYRAIYAGIGSKFGAYSICEAQSSDGLNWERGAPGENLALPPSAEDGDGKWADKMCEYPNVIEEDGKLRLFYCGNGYGATGIGTALAEPLK